jgi:hypothetical protein
MRRGQFTPSYRHHGALRYEDIYYGILDGSVGGKGLEWVMVGVELVRPFDCG